MWDATAKIPSGLLRGNTHQLGDFDLCTEVRTKVKVKDEQPVKVKGKYCMGNIDVRASDEELKLAVHLTQGRNLFRGRLEDVIFFILQLFYSSKYIYLCFLAWTFLTTIFYFEVGYLCSSWMYS